MIFVKTFKGYEDKTSDLDESVNGWIASNKVDVEAVLSRDRATEDTRKIDFDKALADAKEWQPLENRRLIGLSSMICVRRAEGVLHVEGESVPPPHCRRRTPRGRTPCHPLLAGAFPVRRPAERQSESAGGDTFWCSSLEA